MSESVWMLENEVFLLPECICKNKWFGKISCNWIVRLHSQNFGDELTETRPDWMVKFGHGDLVPSSWTMENDSSEKWVETKKSSFLSVRAGRKSKNSGFGFVITIKS